MIISYSVEVREETNMFASVVLVPFMSISCFRDSCINIYPRFDAASKLSHPALP